MRRGPHHSWLQSLSPSWHPPHPPIRGSRSSVLPAGTLPIMLLLGVPAVAATTIAVLLGAVGASAETAAAALDLGATKQPIDGFGTSLCWWAVGVGGWSNSSAFELYILRQ